MTDPYDRLREICLALPEATEKPFGGHTNPAFRVRDKIFVMTTEGDGRISLTFKAPAGAQEFFIHQDPARFFRPPYSGPSGWLGARLDVTGVDWDLLETMILDSYRMIAPKRLAALLTNIRDNSR
jgi:predicted DNA-binding protein (MmcQ/YjbR family)